LEDPRDLLLRDLLLRDLLLVTLLLVVSRLKDRVSQRLERRGKRLEKPSIWMRMLREPRWAQRERLPPTPQGSP